MGICSRGADLNFLEVELGCTWRTLLSCWRGAFRAIAGSDQVKIQPDLQWAGRASNDALRWRVAHQLTLFACNPGRCATPASSQNKAHLAIAANSAPRRPPLDTSASQTSWHSIESFPDIRPREETRGSDVKFVKGSLSKWSNKQGMRGSMVQMVCLGRYDGIGCTSAA